MIRSILQSYWFTIIIVALLALGTWLGCFAEDKSFFAVTQDFSTSGLFIKYCLPFLILTLLIERVIEVVIGIVRDPEANPLREKQIAARFNYLKLHQAMMETNPAVSGYTPIQARVDAAQKALDESTQNLAVYQGQTKILAHQTGFGLGCLVAISGFRMLQSLLITQTPPPASPYFFLTDIFITAAVLSGGSEAFHRLMNVYTSFVDGASKTLDNKSNSNG